MDMEQIIGTVRTFDGALVVTPGPGSGAPELAWGDAFFYHAPEGTMPEREQPYGTVVTKDYPGDDACDLDPDGRWRVNVHVDRASNGTPIEFRHRGRIALVSADGPVTQVEGVEDVARVVLLAPGESRPVTPTVSLAWRSLSQQR